LKKEKEKHLKILMGSEYLNNHYDTSNNKR